MLDKDLPISHSQYHGCWWPDNAGIPGINRHDINRNNSVQARYELINISHELIAEGWHNYT